MHIYRGGIKTHNHFTRQHSDAPEFKKGKLHTHTKQIRNVLPDPRYPTRQVQKTHGGLGVYIHFRSSEGWIVKMHRIWSRITTRSSLVSSLSAEEKSSGSRSKNLATSATSTRCTPVQPPSTTISTHKSMGI